MSSNPQCEYAQTDIPARYLRASLDDAAAESFEAHYFECERCWQELEVGMAMRGARPRRSFAIPLSVAAAAVLVFVSAWIFVSHRPADDRPVYRGAEADAIPITTSSRGDEVLVQWRAVDNASSYTVVVYDAEGTEIHRTTTQARSLTVQRPRRLFVRVEAFNSAGEKIASSSLQPIGAAE